MMFHKESKSCQPSLTATGVMTSLLLLTASASAQTAPEKPPEAAPAKEAPASDSPSPKESEAAPASDDVTKTEDKNPEEASGTEKKDSELDAMAKAEGTAENEVKAWSATEEKAAPQQKQNKKAAVVAAPAAAKVVEKDPEAEIDYDSLPITYHQWRFDLGVGPRFNWVTDSNFDLFSDSNMLTSFNLRGAGTVFVTGKFSLGVTGSWDISGSSGEARNLPTTINLNRFLIGAEGRYHFLPRLAAYGRLEGGLNLLSSRVGAEDDPARLELSSMQFAGALTAGAAFRFAGSRDGRERAVRAHLYLEGGFAYVSGADLVYEVSDDGPLRPEPLDLGSLSLSGAQLAAGLMVSF